MMYGNGVVLLSLFFIRLFYYFAIYDYNPCKGSRTDPLNKKLSCDAGLAFWEIVFEFETPVECNAGPAFREIVLEFETPVECGNGHIHHELAELIPG